MTVEPAHWYPTPIGVGGLIVSSVINAPKADKTYFVYLHVGKLDCKGYYLGGYIIFFIIEYGQPMGLRSGNISVVI